MAAAEEEAAAAAEGDGEGGDEEALRALEEMVAELYRFKDSLRLGDNPQKGDNDTPMGDNNPTGDKKTPTGDKNPPKSDTDPQKGDGGRLAALEEEMERTVQRMEAVHVSPQGRGRALLLRARALEAAPGGRGRAEAALGRALKLQPGLAPAWTRLGEARWSHGDITGATRCFQGALAHCDDPEAHRLLSMALRRGGSLQEGLAQAEAAVRCDPTAGSSWYVLGNAYVSLFFAGGQSPEAARRALGAYAQAEKIDPAAAANPDLHLNRATLLQYQERYGAALEGLARAAALAPEWAEPRMRHARLLDFLGRLCALLGNRGKVRGKRLRGLLGSLPPSLLGPLGGVPTLLGSLRFGANPGRALLGRVLFSLTPDEGVPLTLGVADGAGAVAAVSVFNAAPNWGVLVGDALGLPEPRLRQQLVQHQGKTFSFVSIRVPSPLSLVVNGRRPPPSAAAPPRLQCSNPPN
ncbi:tetratricopeptide repeat protein 5 isoform X2 [Anas platyrhynchos]|uniref:tetratricopeptide repeat protein 5 isoform X2 n=1 Tax=Anas platyrhynchos TaxID=8839 RepID=UPI003AF2A569